MWAITPGIVDSTANPVISSGVNPNSSSTTAIIPTSLIGMSGLPTASTNPRCTSS
jgi:hypothetical protein